MGTYYKTPQEKFEDRRSKTNSVECCIIIEMRVKPSINWKTGLTFKELKELIQKRRNRKFTDQRIYEAISLINRYGKSHGVYLRSGYDYIVDEGNNKKPQFRYFIPMETDDINRERTDLEHKKDIIELKQEHIQYHETVTIPQEVELQQLINDN